MNGRPFGLVMCTHIISSGTVDSLSFWIPNPYGNAAKHRKTTRKEQMICPVTRSLPSHKRSGAGKRPKTKEVQNVAFRRTWIQSYLRRLENRDATRTLTTHLSPWEKTKPKKCVRALAVWLGTACLCTKTKCLRALLTKCLRALLAKCVSVLPKTS